MTWTRQDAITFGIGLGVAVLFQVGTSLMQSGDQVSDGWTWARSFGTGLTTAAGRYIVTELTQRGFRR